MLLKGCGVMITQNKERAIFRDYDILIEGGKIKKIAKNLEEHKKSHEVIDCRNKIVCPSFINMHTHLPMNLMRGFRDDLELRTWLNDIWKVEAKIKEEEYYSGAKFACLEMIKSGTGTFLDMYFGLESIAKAAQEAKLRGYIGRALMDFGDGERQRMVLREAEEDIKMARSRKNPLIVPVISPHSVYTCSKELLEESKNIARKNNLLYTIHLSETRTEVYECFDDYKLRPVEFLDKIGVIDEDFVGFHCGWVTKGEILILGKRKASVVHCPNSNMKLATGGAFPYREFVESKVKIGLGTDSACSNNSLDILSEMKLACLMQKWLRWNACEMVAQDALDMSTINGAQILGLNSGIIEAGKNADIVFFDRKHYSMIPQTSIVSNIVYSASREAITDLMVNGEFVMRDKKVLVMNEEKVKWDFEKASQKLVGGKQNG